jgi:anti-sigma regulatory factor (Ser/Thr protein kinase)
MWHLESGNVNEALRAKHQYLTVLQNHQNWSIDEYAASVIYTELVGNVFRHTASPVELTLECDGIHVLLTVSDHGPGFDFVAPQIPDARTEGGRGLFLVAHYARALEFTANKGKGTTIRAKLRRREEVDEPSFN